MKGIDYEKLFDKLDIKVEPLDENYNPEDFGKRLMSQYKKEDGVIYSSSTQIISSDTDKDQ